MEFYSKFILRTPLFAFNENIDQSLFDEALYLASPSLASEKKKYLTDSKKNTKLISSLYKYESRSKNRCTPFGLFAGVDVGEFGAVSNIIYDENKMNVIQRRTRLDMNVLCLLSDKLSSDPVVRTCIKFYPNNSLYQIGNHYRYINYSYLNNHRIHKIEQVDYSEYLEKIFKISLNGMTLPDIAKALVDDQISYAEASVFIDELVEEKLLINDLQPSLTGFDYLQSMIAILGNIIDKSDENKISSYVATLQDIQASLRVVDKKKIGNDEIYSQILEKVRTLLPEVSETNLFQCDLSKRSFNLTLDLKIQKSLVDTINFLNKITPNKTNKTLTDFKKRFVERYEQEEVNLAEVLDSEIGLGYPTKEVMGINPLVDDILFFQSSDEHNIQLDKFNAVIYKALLKCVQDGDSEIDLEKLELSSFSNFTKNIPHSLCVRFKVLDSIGDKLLLEGLGGSSAINILGRFATSDSRIEEVVREISAFEEQQFKDAILAEIIHLPESRTGNILSRADVRAYEIPYMAKSNKQSDFQIPVSDLYIRIYRDKLVLRSKRLNRQVIPRLGNAHNYMTNSLPLYYFLCDLQYDYFEKSGMAFNWGEYANYFKSLPRVRYKNVILQPAIWRLSRTDYDLLLKSKGNDLDKSLTDFLAKHSIPTKFLLTEGDNKLLIDTQSKHGAITFLDIIKNRPEILLEEPLIEHDGIVKDSKGDSLTNEFIAILLNDNKINLPTLVNHDNNNQRVFIPGSEWVYYKIYAGVKTCDYIISGALYEIVSELYQKNIIKKWFFIRYVDPEHHIRFRVLAAKPEYVQQINNIIYERLLGFYNDKKVLKILQDTYVRELERYGDAIIELVESLFCSDSLFNLQLTRDKLHNSDPNNRWLLGLKSLDCLLDEFAVNLENKSNLIEGLANAFFVEHGGQKELRVQLDAKYRKFRKEIFSVMQSTVSSSLRGNSLAYLAQRKEQNEPIINEIQRLKINGGAVIEINNLLAQLMHMNLNRLFLSNNRINELTLYSMLAKYYKYELAQLKQS